MEKKPAIISCLILIAMLIAVIPRTPVANAAYTKVNIVSDVSELGPADAINYTFKVSCIVENVSRLYGVDIQVGWTTEYIAYVNHTKKIPRNTYPDGILNLPTFPVKNDVNENANMSGSEPGTMYWLVEASMLPAQNFNGTGTAFEIFFKVKKHPVGIDSHIWVNITGATLADPDGYPIARDLTNLHILLHGRLQPAGPEINVGSVNYKGSVPYGFDISVSISNLDAYWDLGGFDIQLEYSTEALQATKSVVDPDGWFAGFWPGGIYVIMNGTDNTIGKVWVAVLGLPSDTGTHTAPYGSATLFTVTFEATGSGPIEKMEDAFSLAGFPHAERPESPYNGSETAVPIPFTSTNGLAHIVGVTDHALSGYIVTTESNSSVSGIFYKEGVPMLLFNVSGPDGFTGYCNVTVPNAFMWSDVTDGWFVLVDGQAITPTITTDATNTYVYFTYQHSMHHITIVATATIPEYNLAAMITLMFSAIAIALARKMTRGKK